MKFVLVVVGAISVALGAALGACCLAMKPSHKSQLSHVPPCCSPETPESRARHMTSSGDIAEEVSEAFKEVGWTLRNGIPFQKDVA